MADTTHEQMAAVRARLTAMLRRVPDKVNCGGHGTAVAYKNDAIKANKALNSSRTSLLALSQACSSIAAYQ